MRRKWIKSSFGDNSDDFHAGRDFQNYFRVNRARHVDRL
jgi:hypothetical protein